MKIIFKAIFSFLIILFFLEFVARFLVVPNENIFLEDSILGWKFIPNKSGTFYNTHFWRPYKFNSEGFLDKDYTVNKTNGVVVTIGDSFIEGLSVNSNETLQEVLERNLSNKYDVINFGVGSFGTYQELLALKTYALKYNPDFVVLGFYMNDYDDNVYALSHYKERPYANFSDNMLKVIPPISPLKTPQYALFVSENFKSIVLLRNIFLRLVDHEKTVAGFDFKNYLSAYHRNYTSMHYEYWNTTFLLIGEIDKTSQLNNATLIVVIIPNSFDIYDDDYKSLINETTKYGFSINDLETNKPRKILRDFLIKKNITFVDTYDVCYNYSKKCYYDFPKDVHWNAIGNKKVAEAINKIISERK